jgi:hypothetical protein
MFRSLSLRIPARLLASPAVTPLPIRTPVDQQLSAELNTLHTTPSTEYAKHSSTSATWLLRTLEASIATQKIALHSLANVTCSTHISDSSDHKAIDEYLDHDSIQMLDACNHLSEKIEIIRKYLESLRVVSHLLGRQIDQPSAVVLARAQDVLESCEEATERRSREMDMRKLLSRRQRVAHSGTTVSELGEILRGSKAVALMACRFLGLALSFKSTRGWLRTTAQSRQPPMTTSWLSSLHELEKKVKVESEKHKRSSSSMTLTELRVTAMAARELRDEIKSGKHNKLGVAVENLQRSCWEVEERIDALEERVKVLYKHLIHVRMALLGILSQA